MSAGDTIKFVKWEIYIASLSRPAVRSSVSSWNNLHCSLKLKSCGKPWRNSKCKTKNQKKRDSCMHTRTHTRTHMHKTHTFVRGVALRSLSQQDNINDCQSLGKMNRDTLQQSSEVRWCCYRNQQMFPPCARSTAVNEPEQTGWVPPLLNSDAGCMMWWKLARWLRRLWTLHLFLNAECWWH